MANAIAAIRQNHKLQYYYNMEPIILASGSPRRKDYLKLLGLPLTCMPSDIDEGFDPHSDPRTVTENLAVKKVEKVVEILKKDASSSLAKAWVCGADTLISLGGKIYGKPLDRGNARGMLGDFQGKTHEVISTVALYCGKSQKMDFKSVASAITFAPMTLGEIEWYLDTGEWQDAAGAYKIQGKAACFITEIRGSYSSIVGLPLREFYAILRDNGYPYGG